ncbi:MAG: hypothetical protein AB8B85_02750 [Paracoccaceae bacterium]
MNNADFELGLRELVQSAGYDDYPDVIEEVYAIFGHDSMAQAERWLARNDRFFLLSDLLNRPDVDKRWLYERCREVEANPDGYLDLWAREHYKSTLITFAGIIQEILRDPNIKVGIFSHTKPIAKGFLIQIKREFETNDRLKRLFPDILYANPQRESPQWSLDGGIVVRRSSNSKEATVEGHGLVDGQPTSKHFDLLAYDDVVTLESVGTPEQIEKTTNAWSLSDNLGARSKGGMIRKWHIGTRYHFADSYHTMIERKSVIPRIYPATDDGTADGKPVLLTQEAWDLKKRDQVAGVLAAQMLQNPAAGNSALFDVQWLQFADVRPGTLNVYIMCDPASSRKKGSDYTTIAVIGVDVAGNYWLLDGCRDKLKLAGRWKMLRYFHNRWRDVPGVQALHVGYERYGMQSDIEHFEDQMEREGAHFPIQELAWPRDGTHAKEDRIQRLEPDFRNKRFYMAAVVESETRMQRHMRVTGEGYRIFTPTRRKDFEGNIYSLNKVLIDEYLTFPFSVHDDLLDAVSRIKDMDPATPVILSAAQLQPTVYEDGI